MTIDSEDFKTFFEVAFDVTDVAKLKCFKCGKGMEELGDQSGLTCTNGHDIGYLEYMTTYASMLNDVFLNADIGAFTFQKKVIEPSNIMYCGNAIVFNEKQILRS